MGAASAEPHAMGTSDGISTEDWDVVHGLAVDVVNAPDDEYGPRRQLLEFLETLESKYGPLPSILATRADYLTDEDLRREELLLRAHALAESRGDSVSGVDIAESLVDLYLEKVDLSEASRWLSRMRDHLTDLRDAGHSDYDFWVGQYRKLAIRPR